MRNDETNRAARVTGSIQPKQAADIYARWGWVEHSVWTERMLTALEQGVKGGCWFSLIDKVCSQRCLIAAGVAIPDEARIPDGTVLGARGPFGPYAPDNAYNRWFAKGYEARFQAPPPGAGPRSRRARGSGGPKRVRPRARRADCDVRRLLQRVRQL